MIERDYIMRMITQLTQFLTRVLLHKAAFEFPLARRELDAAYKSLLGFDPEFIRQFSDEQIIAFFGKDKHIVVAKCYALGSLLKVEGEILIQSKEKEQGEGELARALHLLLTAYTRAGNEAEQDHSARIEELLTALRDRELAPEVRAKLMRWYELTRRFDRAENILFELVAADARWKTEGMLMYERLLALPDDVLVAGGLPRPEVEDAMREMQTD
jgi:hypothetical protein